MRSRADQPGDHDPPALWDAEMTTEILPYCDYEITATYNPPVWNVGTYPTLSWLPKPLAKMIVDADKEWAIAEAKRRIDVMLHGCGASSPMRARPGCGSMQPCTASVASR